MRRRKVAAAAMAMTMGGVLLAQPASASRSHPNEARFRVTIENRSDEFALSGSGVFNTPTGADAPGPVFPGESYSFDIHANPGDHLSLATMLVQSNDWFFSPGESGVALHTGDGTPVAGDITSSFHIIDAGTEIDQTPGSGPDQAPRQSGPNTGADDPDDLVRIVESTPAVEELIQVTSTPGDNGLFTIEVTNVSGDSSLPTPLAPGVFAVHQAPAPLFTLGQPDRGEGLEAVAEDGNPGGLADVLSVSTGIATPLAPGVFVAKPGVNPLFRHGKAASDNGLEALAEDGMSDALLASIGGTSDSAGTFGPIGPGQSTTFEFTAKPGERLYTAAMFVQSNDWFFSGASCGLGLFQAGEPISGNLNYHYSLYDAGTEIDQVVGFGPDQAPRQAGPNTGADDPDATVRVVSAEVGRYINVRIDAIG